MPDDKRKPGSVNPVTRKNAADSQLPDAAGSPRPFDVKIVEYLVKLMKEYDLSEIDLREGHHRVRLLKSHEPLTTSSSMMTSPTGSIGAAATPGMILAQPPLAAKDVSPPPSTPTVAPQKKLIEIKSELIGTFYAKPKPDKDDYVKVGSRVTPDTVVCQIEAMKIFNEIRAGVSGTIAEVCVKNGEPVEYNTVLFRVDPS